MFQIYFSCVFTQSAVMPNGAFLKHNIASKSNVYKVIQRNSICNFLPNHALLRFQRNFMSRKSNLLQQYLVEIWKFKFISFLPLYI